MAGQFATLLMRRHPLWLLRLSPHPQQPAALEHPGKLSRMLAVPLFAPCSPPRARYLVTFAPHFSTFVCHFYFHFVLHSSSHETLSFGFRFQGYLPIVTLISYVSAIAVSRPLALFHPHVASESNSGTCYS